MSGSNEMCIHIGGLLHKVHSLKLGNSNTTTTTTVSAQENVENQEYISTGQNFSIDDDIDCNIFLEESTALPPTIVSPPTRLKRKKRVKLYVCGICSAQFPDKKTFMNHCQMYHALPTLLHKDAHKRRVTQPNDDDNIIVVPSDDCSENTMCVKNDSVQQEVISLEDFLIHLDNNDEEDDDDIDGAELEYNYDTVTEIIDIDNDILNNATAIDNKIIDNTHNMATEDPVLIIIDDDDDESSLDKNIIIG